MRKNFIFTCFILLKCLSREIINFDFNFFPIPDLKHGCTVKTSSKNQRKFCPHLFNQTSTQFDINAFNVSSYACFPDNLNQHCIKFHHSIMFKARRFKNLTLEKGNKLKHSQKCQSSKTFF